MKFVDMITYQVPSVTMNGGSFTLDTRKPLRKPQAPPTRKPMAMAIGAGSP